MASNPHIRLIFCFVFITRALFCIVYAGDDRHFSDIDSASYLSPAQALLTNQAFLAAPHKWSEPETIRTPGYPLWLAFNISIFGKKLYLIVLGQILLFLVTLYLTAVVAEKLFGEKAVLPAVLFLALDPASFTYSLKVLTETLTTLFCMIFSCSLVSYFKGDDVEKHALAAGFALSLATLTRPTTYYFPLLLAVLLLIFYYRRNVGWKAGLHQFLLVFLPFFLLIGSWQVRNYCSAGTFAFSTVEGVGALSTKIIQIISIKEGISGQAAADHQLKEVYKEHPNWDALSANEQYALLRQKFMAVVLGNPWLSLKTHFIQLGNLLFEPGSTSSLFRLFDPEFKSEPFNWHEKGGYLARMLLHRPLFILSSGLGVMFLVLLYGLLVCSLYFVSRRLDSDIWPHLALWIFIGYIINVYSLGMGYSRHRVVVMPLFCIYAAGGFTWVVKLIKSAQKKGA